MARANSKPVYGEMRGKAYWIYLNRPEKRNAMNREAWVRLKEELSKACSSDAGAVVITGKGKAFSAGDDILDMYKLGSLEEAIGFFEEISGTLETMVECPKPVIAAVNGVAEGGGAEILLAADMVVAARTAWFSFPEISLGLVPPVLSTLGMLSLGFRRAKFLAMTAQRLSSEEARLYGLVDLVVEDYHLEREVEALVEDLSNYPPEALARIKRLTNTTAVRIVERLEDAIKELAEASQTEEAKTRMLLFLERRKRR